MSVSTPCLCLKYASHIHAFEPWSKVRQAIDEKITRNRLTNVTVHPVALGESINSFPSTLHGGELGHRLFR